MSDTHRIIFIPTVSFSFGTGTHSRFRDKSLGIGVNGAAMVQ